MDTVTLITQVGFPIAACVSMGIVLKGLLEKTLVSLSQAQENNKEMQIFINTNIKMLDARVTKLEEELRAERESCCN